MELLASNQQVNFYTNSTTSTIFSSTALAVTFPLSANPHLNFLYVGIGGVIFFTGLLAALSSGYAFYTIFDSTLFACIFGFIWGFKSYIHLYSFIVALCANQEECCLFMALPRIILATVLGIVISKPLEFKIFEKKLISKLNVIINRNKVNFRKK